MIEKGISKQMKETDSLVTHLPKLSGMVKKRYGKLSLTKSGPKILSNNKELLKTIWETYTTKFNWAYNDGYGNNNIGQIGYAYTLVLLSKYGDEEKSDNFYAENTSKPFLCLEIFQILVIQPLKNILIIVFHTVQLMYLCDFLV